FEKGEMFKRDVKIVVNYHSFPERNEPGTGPEASDQPEAATIDLPYWCGDAYKFGEAATMDLRYTRKDISVEISVEAPVAVTAPARNPEANASFTVTLKNLSEADTWDPML